MELLTPAHVQAALDAFGLGLTIRFFDNSTATSPLAAQEIGCELGQIAKSICFLVGGQPIVCITAGDQRVDDRKLAALLGVGRKQVAFASADDCVNVFGYAPGSVPPVAHRTPLRAAFLDESFHRFSGVYPAGGAANAIFGPVTPEQLQQLTGGQWADVRREG